MASWRNYEVNCRVLPRVLALAVLFLDAIPASAQQLPAHQARATLLAASAPVTPENFPRAESDLYFGNIVKDDGFGKQALIKAVPYKIHTVLTDNGIQFADLAKNCSKPTAMWRGHPFDRACRQHGIEHRLTKPSHPWTNGQSKE